MHFESGILEALFFLWLLTAHPSRTLLNGTPVQKALQLLSLVALLSTLWETVEFSYDAFRMIGLHLNLLSPINILVQPSNADTMGDLVFSMAGALATILSVWIVDRIRKRLKG